MPSPKQTVLEPGEKMAETLDSRIIKHQLPDYFVQGLKTICPSQIF